jgi:hypothetical protein
MEVSSGSEGNITPKAQWMSVHSQWDSNLPVPHVELAPCDEEGNFILGRVVCTCPFLASRCHRGRSCSRPQGFAWESQACILFAYLVL